MTSVMFDVSACGIRSTTVHVFVNELKSMQKPGFAFVIWQRPGQCKAIRKHKLRWGFPINAR